MAGGSPGAPARLLVTGAQGFVGQHLLPVLRARLPRSTLLTPRLDVADAAGLRDWMLRERPDACLHLAAVAAIGAAQADPDLAWRVNLHGTLNIARALRDAAPPDVTPSLVFVSSADGYGASFKAALPLDETAPLAPMNTYGATKAAADLALGAMARDGLHVVRLRPFNHVGPGQGDGFALPAFARQLAAIAARRQPPVLSVGNLEASRDFLDVRDVCAAYAACLDRLDRLESGTILNIASGVPRRIGDVLEALVAVSGLDVQVRLDPARLRPSDIPVAIGDAGRARTLLDWQPRVAWTQTLEDIVQDWMQRPI